MIGQDARVSNLARAEEVLADPTTKPRTKRLAHEWKRNLECDLLPAAQELRDLGLSVIPILANKKKPPIEWGPFQTRRATPGELREWFSESSNLQLGVVCGTASDNLVVRDFDQAGAYDAWRGRHKALAAELPTARTGRDGGGFHVYARVEGDCPSFVTGNGECKGNGNYVVAPPSRHPLGRRYEWIVPPKSVPWIDLAELLDGASRPAPNGAKRNIERSYVTPVRGEPLTPALVAELVRATAPTARGQHHERVFEYVRQLRGYAELADAGPDVLEPMARQWYEAAKPFTEESWRESWRQFRSGWERVRFPGGCGAVVDDAAAVAASSPLPAVAMRFKHPHLRLLIATCAELQRRRGSEYFFLSCRDAARAIGMESARAHITVWGWLQLLCREGVLELVERGTPGMGATGKASRFFYKGD